MRLQLQFQRSDGTWRRLGRSGDSGFLALGRGDAKLRQAGRTFTMTPPAEGQAAFVLRGLATFEWRRDGDVIRRARRATSAGHETTPGADPPGYSAATCSVR
jgi:Ser/Thr protein kinase RdoA (MazF antagonist)